MLRCDSAPVATTPALTHYRLPLGKEFPEKTNFVLENAWGSYETRVQGYFDIDKSQITFNFSI